MLETSNHLIVGKNNNYESIEPFKYVEKEGFSWWGCKMLQQL